jgi:hypothetical protein
MKLAGHLSGNTTCAPLEKAKCAPDAFAGLYCGENHGKRSIRLHNDARARHAVGRARNGHDQSRHLHLRRRRRVHGV